MLGNKILRLSAIAAAMVTLPGYSLAQTIEEVIITAQKREQNLQDIPIAITSVTGDELTRQNIFQLNDLDKIVPELQIFSAESMSVISIRGVQSRDFGPTSEQANVVNLDGAVLARSGALEGFFFDLERVEVLKGPQGTLYGRGAVAGAINMITRKPTMDEVTGYVEAEYADYNSLRGEGAVNLPITEDWAVRAAFRTINRDGYYEPSGLQDLNSQSMRLSSLWEIDDRSSLLITTDVENLGGLGAGFQVSQYLGTYGDLTLADIPNSPYNNDSWYNTVAENTSQDSTTWGAMVQYDYDFDFATATVQYSHRDQDQLLLNQIAGLSPAPPFPAPPTPLPITDSQLYFGPLDLATTMKSNSDSLEARLTSTSSQPIEWIVGVFAFQETINKETCCGFVAEHLYPKDTDSFAIFGESTWTPEGMDSLHLTLGARYSEDEKSLRSDNSPPIDIDTASTTKADWSKTTWKVNLSYDVNENSMLYGQVATGYKSGDISPSQAVAGPENMTAYEIGSKNLFMDGRFQLNLEAFLYDYENYQAFFNAAFCTDGSMMCPFFGPPGTPVQYQRSTTINPGGAEQWGLGVSALWLVTDSDTVSLNASYNHNQYGDYDQRIPLMEEFADSPDPVTNLTPGMDLTDEEFGGTPFRGNANYTHMFELANGNLDFALDLFFEGDAIDSNMQLNTPGQYTMPGRGSYFYGNLSLRYAPSDQDWSIRGYMNNFWDTDDLTALNYTDSDRSGIPQFLPQSGYTTGVYVLPRSMGISFRANF